MKKLFRALLYSLAALLCLIAVLFIKMLLTPVQERPVGTVAVVPLLPEASD